MATVTISGTDKPVQLVQPVNASGAVIANTALSVTGGGTEATALRVTIASDSTGVLSVDDGGGSLTIDGTVTANVTKASSLATGQNALSTTAEVVIASNASRIYAEVKNSDSTISMYIGDDNTVSSTTGHLLAAGATFGFENYTGAVWAVAASGTPTITFVEW